MTIEYRHCPAELRATTGDRPRIVGYAATFGRLSAPLSTNHGQFRERILPGEFRRTLAEAGDVLALVAHDPRSILGRRKAGTLSLAEDSRGLRVEIDPPDTTLGRDTVELVRRGLLDSMSFGFNARQDRWAREGETRVRELVDVDLIDVSLTAVPAYPDTSVAVRSLESWTAREERSGLDLAIMVREIRI